MHSNNNCTFLHLFLSILLRTFYIPKDLTDKILQVYSELVIPYLDKGLCGCVYTQLTDIEDEINGFYTYDRLICKVDPDRIREMNQKIRY